jgi:hypothetical protein
LRRQRKSIISAQPEPAKNVIEMLPLAAAGVMGLSEKYVMHKTVTLKFFNEYMHFLFPTSFFHKTQSKYIPQHLLCSGGWTRRKPPL